MVLALTIFVFFSCQKKAEPILDTSEFILQDGFSIKLIAAEPLLDSPVAMQFDKRGRIWVVELPGYMRDIDGSDEDLPDGKIAILTDEDQDGQMDTRSIFLDSLLAPRTLALVYDGLLYSEGTNLWWTSIENDQPGQPELVDSLYVIGGNIEHQPNGLLYNLDNWIYSAKSNARYRRKDGVWLKEATSFRGQWGLTHDNQGRLFYNSNSDPLIGDYVMPNVLIQNPFQKIKYGLQQRIADDFRVFPYQATAVNRGYEEGVLDENDKLTTFTSACGPLIYLGGQFPDQYYGNAFVCGPEANLIKRYILENDGVKTKAKLAYFDDEFLFSKDETFRPVNLYTGYDGALYIVDLRQGIIQHRAYMTSYLREKILTKGLEKINGIGRIYQVVSTEKVSPKLNDYSKFRTKDFLPLLNNKNLELRMLAQREIIFSGDKSLKDDLVKIAMKDSGYLGRIHALWTLEGLGILDDTILSDAFKNTDFQQVKQQIIYLSTLENSNESTPIFQESEERNNQFYNLYLCHYAGKLNTKKGDELWLDLAKEYSNDPIYCEALISGISEREALFLKKIKDLKNDSIYFMLNQVIFNKKNNEIQAPQLMTKPFLDDRTAGFKLYNTYCVACHGYDGKGVENLAPPLYPSEYVTGPTERMILIALQGLKGPVTVNGKKYEMNLVMPGIKNNPELTDKKIADLMVFIKNSFAVGFPAPINEELVGGLRQKLEGREEMFTIESLEKWMAENLE
ncbi:MAG: c-type cytochrome [Saprospiraceae bacterium]